jgi:hypothetical protein
VHLQDGDTIDPSANFEDRSDSGDSSGSEDPVEDRSDSGDSSGSEDPSDSGDSSGSKDPSDSEEHSALFEVAEEILEWPTQPDDLSFDQDYSSEDTDQMEDTAGMEDSALFEALEESSRTIKLNTSLPEAVVQLQEKLLGDYTLPPPPVGIPVPYALSMAEELSLQHYLAWTESQGTVKAYSAHAKVLAKATNVEILSLHSVRKLAEKLTGLKPTLVDMCPRSCIAYTGDFQFLSQCTHIHNRKVCNEPRYKQKQGPRAIPKPRAQMLYIPITPIIQTHYSVAETSREMRFRDKCLQETLKLLAVAAGVNQKERRYSDFANSEVHVNHYQKLGLFKDARDTAITISTDGAQLTMKKQSNVWLLIVVLLNLPPEMRYRANNIIIPLAIPGPSSPGNIESFIYPLFQELAMASEGIWTWDAVDSSYFVLRAYLCGVKGDMLGSAKLNGMAGHAARYGDRFSMVQGARIGKEKGAKQQYYPLSPPEKEKFNAGRPDINLNYLPMREQSHYWMTIKRLLSAQTPKEQKAITGETGISRLTLCSTSPAFSHPSFFPLDPFHLFYENCMLHIWDLWVSHSSSDEKIHMNEEIASQLGKEIEKAVKTLPPAFCGPIRDPYKKRQSQYKVYEWMALLHWYIIPIAWELNFDEDVLKNFGQFADIVETAMTISPRSDKDLAELQALAVSFLHEFERLYVGKDPMKVSRCRLCIFQLIHVPHHILWHGSIRFGSQATVERAIGEMGRKIRSKKAPFANLANIIFERATVKMLTLKYPVLSIAGKEKRQREDLHQPLNIRKAEKREGTEFHTHLNAICEHFDMHFNWDIKVQRWGKCTIKGVTLRSRISELRGQASRSSRYFEANRGIHAKRPTFGEALAFYSAPEYNLFLVVYRPVVEKFGVVGRWGGEWSEEIRVMETSCLISLIGIWEYESRVHILRKHPGLDMLSPDECGFEGMEDEEDS